MNAGQAPILSNEKQATVILFVLIPIAEDIAVRFYNATRFLFPRSYESRGLSVLRASGDLRMATRRADEALYAAKCGGRDRIESAD